MFRHAIEWALAHERDLQAREDAAKDRAAADRWIAAINASMIGRRSPAEPSE